MIADYFYLYYRGSIFYLFITKNLTRIDKDND